MNLDERESARAAGFPIDRQHDLRRRRHGAEVACASRLRWCCRRDYRRTDGRPINCLLIWEEGARKREVAGAHAGSRFQWEKPYLNSRHGASGGYSKAFTGFSQGGCMSRRSPVDSRVGCRAGRRGGVRGDGRRRWRRRAIKSPDLREWLTYIASDELEGRAVFTTGFGLAAGYIEDHLHAWGVKPAGDHGSYLQTVRVLGVKTTSRSTVTVDRERRDADVRRRRRASRFRGTWAASVGSRSTAWSSPATASTRPGASHMRFSRQGRARTRRSSGSARTARRTSIRRLSAALLGGRNRYATEQLGAAASIGPLR